MFRDTVKINSEITSWKIVFHCAECIKHSSTNKFIDYGDGTVAFVWLTFMI